MIKRIIAILIISTRSCMLLSQTDSVKVPFLKVVSAGINMGALFTVSPLQNDADRQLEEFRKIAPHSKYTHPDLTGYRKGMASPGNFLMGILIDCNPMDHKTKDRNKNVIYRFELLYNHKQTIAQTYRRIDSTVVDTLYSTYTGVSFKDSAEYSQNYFYDFEGRNIGIGCSMIRLFREGKNLRPYLGYGVCLALSYNNQMRIAHSNLSDGYNRGSIFSRWNGNQYADEEIYKFNNNITGMVYIPFGIGTYRKVKPSWISFFIDVKVGCKFEKYPSATYTAIPFISTQAGVKFFHISKK